MNVSDSYSELFCAAGFNSLNLLHLICIQAVIFSERRRLKKESALLRVTKFRGKSTFQ